MSSRGKCRRGDAQAAPSLRWRGLALLWGAQNNLRYFRRHAQAGEKAAPEARARADIERHAAQAVRPLHKTLIKGRDHRLQKEKMPAVRVPGKLKIRKGRVLRRAARLMRQKNPHAVGRACQGFGEIRAFAAETLFRGIGKARNDHGLAVHRHCRVRVAQHADAQALEHGQPFPRIGIILVVAGHAENAVPGAQLGQGLKLGGQLRGAPVDHVAGQQDQIRLQGIGFGHHFLQPALFPQRAHVQIRKLRQGQAVQRRGQAGHGDFQRADHGRFARLPHPEQGQDQRRRRQPGAARERRERQLPGAAQQAAEPEEHGRGIFDEQQEKKQEQKSVGCLHDQQERLGQRRDQKGAAETLVKHIFQPRQQQQQPGRKLEQRPNGHKQDQTGKDVGNNKKRGQEKSHGFPVKSRMREP